MRIARTHCIDTLADMVSAPVSERVVELRDDAAVVDRVLDDIRQRIADGERSPVLARHMTALGLDDVLLALAREP